MSELTAELVADGAPELHPVISPDGRWVAFVDDGLWVVPADVTTWHPLPGSPGTVVGP